MTTSTPFPGMDPFLERRGLWEDVHTRLIVAIADALTPHIRPKYRAVVEQRAYLSVYAPNPRAGKPDVMIALNEAKERYEARPASAIGHPIVAELPMPEEVIEHFLEIRSAENDNVITVIELLSPTNKMTREGREEYERKRMTVLRSMTHLVEIDLIRAGQPFAFKLRGGGSAQSDYRITISREYQRPQADVYLFSLRDAIPDFPIPLIKGESEPILPLNTLLHSLFERADYDRAVHYEHPLTPPLTEADAIWFASLLQK